MASFVQILESWRAEANPLETEKFKAMDHVIHTKLVKNPDLHPCTPEVQQRFRDIFDRFRQIARSKHAFANDGLKAKATLAPIEFVAIVRMIDKYPHSTDKELVNAIRVMRRDVRKAHDDNVRRKPIVWDTLVAITDRTLGGAANDSADGVIDNGHEAEPTAEESERDDSADEILLDTRQAIHDDAADESPDDIDFVDARELPTGPRMQHNPDEISAAPTAPMYIYDDENDLDYRDDDDHEDEDEEDEADAFMQSVAAFDREHGSTPPVARGLKRTISGDLDGRHVRRRLVRSGHN